MFMVFELKHRVVFFGKCTTKSLLQQFFYPLFVHKPVNF
jgi:hypothetical protein